MSIAHRSRFAAGNGLTEGPIALARLDLDPPNTKMSRFHAPDSLMAVPADAVTMWRSPRPPSPISIHAGTTNVLASVHSCDLSIGHDSGR